MTSHPFDSIYQDFFGEPPKKNEKDTANRVPAQATLDQQLEALSSLQTELQEHLKRDGISLSDAGAPDSVKPASFDGVLEEVKASVWGQDEFLRSLLQAFRRPFLLTPPADGPKNTLLLSGGVNTGRHYALQTICTCLYKRGLLPNDTLTVMDLSLYPTPAEETVFYQDLYAALQNPSCVLLWEHEDACAPLCLKVIRDLVMQGRYQLPARYVEQKGLLVAAGTALAPTTVSCLRAGDKYFVFFSEKGPDSLAAQFGAPFMAHVTDCCETLPLSPDARQKIVRRELTHLVQKARDTLHLTLTWEPEVADAWEARYRESSGARELLQMGQDLFRALGEYCLKQESTPDQPLTLSVKDNVWMAARPDEKPFALFSQQAKVPQGNLEKIEQEWQRMIGLQSVKQTIHALQELFTIQQRRRQEGLKAEPPSMHMIFTGNPGTGKTTVARLTGQYLKAIGALSGGQLIEVSRADLVGRYVGHTAPLVNSVLRSALGGVLFIDEAYSLCRGEDDSFGMEAVDTLVKGMEDHRQELIVILAGYTKEMDEFLRSNSGLASRFPHRIEFPDYTGDELWQIACLQAEQKGYRITPSCREKLVSYFTAVQAQSARTGGNGRLARNVVEAAITRQAGRLIRDPKANLSELVPDDFSLPNNIELSIHK